MPAAILCCLVFGGAGLWLAWNAYTFIRDGRAWGFFLPGNRATSPILFWMAVGVQVLGICVCAFALIWGAIANF